MLKRLLVGAGVVFIAFGFLFISITQTAQVKYSFSENSNQNRAKVLGDEVLVDYELPYTGRIAPDHPLWSVKAARDALWLLVTPKAERRAELNLLYANKRLVSAKELFENNKPELAMSVLIKAENYLSQAQKEEEIARKNGVDTKAFLQSLSLASLKHREIIKEILEIAPDDAKSEVVKAEDFSVKVYEDTKNTLLSQGLIPPEDPF